MRQVHTVLAVPSVGNGFSDGLASFVAAGKGSQAVRNYDAAKPLQQELLTKHKAGEANFMFAKAL